MYSKFGVASRFSRRSLSFGVTLSMALGIAALTAGTAALSGCGSGGRSISTGVGAASAYAGHRTSTVTLPDGKTGVIDVTVADSGAVSGTLTVSEAPAASLTKAATRQSQSFAFGVGTYSISGTVDPQTGAFSLTGSIGGQAFTMTGTFSPNGGGGSYTLTAGGQTVSGTFGGPVATPKPGTTPTPGATPTPTSGAGSQSLTFTDNTTDATLPPFSNPEYRGDTISPGTNGATSYLVSAVYREMIGTTIRGLTVTFTRQDGAVVPGVYGAGASTNNTYVIIGYVDSNYTPGAYSQKSYLQKSGTVELVALSGSQATVRLHDVVLTGSTLSSESTGSFTVNGDLTVPVTAP